MQNYTEIALRQELWNMICNLWLEKFISKAIFNSLRHGIQFCKHKKPTNSWNITGPQPDAGIIRPLFLFYSSYSCHSASAVRFSDANPHWQKWYLLLYKLHTFRRNVNKIGKILARIKTAVCYMHEICNTHNKTTLIIPYHFRGPVLSVGALLFFCSLHRLVTYLWFYGGW